VKKPDTTFALLARYLPLTIIMPASIFAGYALGYGLDYLFSTHYLKFVFMVLGVVSAFLKVFQDLSRDP
jgi:hypothetical protein